MSPPDLFTLGDEGFVFFDETTPADRRRANIVIGVSALVAVLAIIGAFVSLDRSAPPLPGDSLSPVWLRAPVQGFERERRP